MQGFEGVWSETYLTDVKNSAILACNRSVRKQHGCCHATVFDISSASFQVEGAMPFSVGAGALSFHRLTLNSLHMFS